VRNNNNRQTVKLAKDLPALNGITGVNGIKTDTAVVEVEETERLELNSKEEDQMLPTLPYKSRTMRN
jgi:hypothetical protein